MPLTPNPISVHRQFIYDSLISDGILTTIDTSRVWPSRPIEGSPYPLIYLELPVTSGEMGMGGYLIATNAPIQIHLVGERDQNYSDLDPIANEILALFDPLQRVDGQILTQVTAGGQQISATLSPDNPMFPLSYSDGADEWPRYIISVRVFAAFSYAV